MVCMESLKLFILPTAMASMYPYKANLSGGLEFTGTLQSPSGTILKKDLEIQGLFFACRKLANRKVSRQASDHTSPSNQKLYFAVTIKLHGSPYTSYGLHVELLAIPW